MQSDALYTVLLLRQRAVEEARRHLMRSIEADTLASDAARSAERHIAWEAEQAAVIEGDDRLVDAFAAWLPGARHRASQVRAWQVQTEAEVTRNRAELAACQSALEVIEALLTERRAAKAHGVARRAQQILDEIASMRARNPT